jgi:hypothetical protein
VSSWCCSLPAVTSVWALCQTEHHPDFDISYCPSVCHCSDHSIALLYAHCSPAGWKFAPCTASRTWSAIEEGNPSPSPKSPPITIKLTKDVQTMLNTGINLPNPVHAHHESQPHRPVPVECHPFQFTAPSIILCQRWAAVQWWAAIWAWRSVSACRHVRAHVRPDAHLSRGARSMSDPTASSPATVGQTTEIRLRRPGTWLNCRCSSTRFRLTYSFLCLFLSLLSLCSLTWNFKEEWVQTNYLPKRVCMRHDNGRPPFSSVSFW